MVYLRHSETETASRFAFVDEHNIMEGYLKQQLLIVTGLVRSVHVHYRNHSFYSIYGVFVHR